MTTPISPRRIMSCGLKNCTVVKLGIVNVGEHEGDLCGGQVLVVCECMCVCV